MTVSELKALLVHANDDAKVFFYLNQFRCSPRLAVTEASAFSSEEGECTFPEEADEIYLHGTDDGYAPRAAMEEFIR
jgi:hypothetical protein